LIADDTAVRTDIGHAVQTILSRQAQRRAFFAGLAESLPEKLGVWFDLERYSETLLSRVSSTLITADLGCGPGWLLPDLAGRCTKLIGIDHVPEVLSLARQKAVRHNLGNCEFRLGELEHLPLSDGEVERVVLGLVLQHVVDPPAVLSEAARALRHSGQLIIVEPARHEMAKAREDLGEVWMGFDVDDLKTWLSAAGFSTEEIERVSSTSAKLDLLAISARKC
jgi:ArsR family transcriptional regulator